MRPLAAQCHFGLGKLYVRDGKHAMAVECLTEARIAYREMGMRSSLEQVDALLENAGEDSRRRS